MKITILALAACLACYCCAEEDRETRRRLEDERVEKKVVEDQLEEQRLDNMRRDREIEDNRIDEARRQRRREDDAAWNRRHGRLF